MFCKKCGAEMEEGTKFCPSCGAGREEHGGAAATQNVEGSGNVSGLAGDNSQKGKIIAIIVLVLVLLGGGFSLFGGKPKNTTKDAIAVKSETIIDDYIRDSATAKSKYDGKHVTITGKVYTKGQFNNDVDFCVTLYMKNAGGKRYSVALAVPVVNVNIINKLKDTDAILAEGEFLGIVPQKDPLDVNIQIKPTEINGEKIKQ